VVVLNTARSQELTATFGKLSTLIAHQPEVQLALFGYTEWMMYVNNYQISNFYRYNAYIPAPFYTNLTTPQTERLMQKYRQHFRQDMMNALPRFALTGFDHAMFFLQGFQKFGKSFTGIPGQLDYEPVQTPLKFERQGSGGFRNRQLLFVHYLPEQRVETIKF
jgi:hypothetical protein